MRGPHITPQQWFHDLPDLPRYPADDSLAIFTGVVNGISNLVVHASATLLGMVIQSTGVFWRFNYENGRFEAVEGEGTGWSNQIIEQAGLTQQQASSLTLQDVTTSMVKYKFAPV